MVLLSYGIDGSESFDICIWKYKKMSFTLIEKTQFGYRYVCPQKKIWYFYPPSLITISLKCETKLPFSFLFKNWLSENLISNIMQFFEISGLTLKHTSQRTTVNHRTTFLDLKNCITQRGEKWYDIKKKNYIYR